MHGYDVHEVLYLNREIHGPWIRGQNLGLSQYGHKIKIVEIFFSIPIYILKKYKCMVLTNLGV